MKRSLIAAFGAIATVTTVAFAASFDSATGTGTIGKGEVQEAFGWNNKLLQANAQDLEFSVVEKLVRYADCRPQGNPHLTTIRLVDERTQTRYVGSEVAYDAKQRKQVVGFNLKGFQPQPHNLGGVETVNCPQGYVPVGGGWSAWESEWVKLFVATPGRTAVELAF